MLIKFAKSADIGDRHYSRGDTREIDDEVAARLIVDGIAIDPSVTVAIVTATWTEGENQKTSTVNYTEYPTPEIPKPKGKRK